MFGKAIRSTALARLALLGFCIYVLRLFIRDEINLYIHPRYNLFTLVMCVLAIAFLAVESYLGRKEKPPQPVADSSSRIINVVVLAVLALAIFIPAQPLTSEVIGRRSLVTPDVEAGVSLSSSSADECVETDYQKIEVLVFDMARSPADCFTGQAVELTGFVIDSPSEPLPGEYFYLGRVILACCAVDARPYALPVTKVEGQVYGADSWFTIIGTLETTTINGRETIVVQPNSTQAIPAPTQPYGYLN